jgi:hypothetical protein
MPQTITLRVQATITLAANDLCTVNLPASEQSELALKNNGPGAVWVSFDPTVPAAVSNANCFVLLKGEAFATDRVFRGTGLTLNADTASTIATMVLL